MTAIQLIQKLSILGLALAASPAFTPALQRAHAAAEIPSAYECKNLEKASEIQLLEGREGMFFRVIPDIKMYHPFTDATIADLARLSRVLKSKGTTLIYVPVPTKSMVLPDLLPERAKLFGFDPTMANSIYNDVIQRLEAKGVAAVDIATPMRAHSKGANGDFAFFKTDFHWTGQGAGPAARDVAARISLFPEFEGKTNLDAAPAELPSEKISSTMRKIVQRFCRLPVPIAAAHPYQFAAAGSDIFGDKEAALPASDIFADGPSNRIALVGTSFSDMPVSNFAGFLEYYSGLPVENYSISGGNQFGSILSYLTSREFQKSRPKFLVWENPIYNNLAQFGDAPLMEVLAASNEDCGRKLPAEKVDGRTMTIDLAGTKLASDDIFLADIGGNSGRRASFKFTLEIGGARERVVERGERLRSTGRYFLPLNDLAGEQFSKLAVTFDADLSESTSVSICKVNSGDNQL
jgi:alginate biosynthesis protein AlgX